MLGLTLTVSEACIAKTHYLSISNTFATSLKASMHPLLSQKVICWICWISYYNSMYCLHFYLNACTLYSLLQKDGLHDRILLALAFELNKALPRIMKKNPLKYLWAYKYDSEYTGISTHADQVSRYDVISFFTVYSYPFICSLTPKGKCQR